jgi:transcriptional regulator with XRE-family HTH domain
MKSFGKYIRTLREDKKITLRKFADSIGITPTYLSKIEREELTTTPSEEVIAGIASKLGADFDELMILAGRIPAELPEIIMQHPREMAMLLRTAKKMNAEQIEELTKRAERKINSEDK